MGVYPKVPRLEKWSRAPYYWGEGWAQSLEYDSLKKQLLQSRVHCAMMLTSAAQQEQWAGDGLNALGDLSQNVYHCSGLSDPMPFDRSAYTFTQVRETP